MIQIAKCSYCGGEIPKGHYVLKKYVLGIVKGYCHFECKHRAGTLRMGVRNPEKYMPKHLDEIDKDYIEKVKENGI